MLLYNSFFFYFKENSAQHNSWRKEHLFYFIVYTQQIKISVQ